MKVTVKLGKTQKLILIELKNGPKTNFQLQSITKVGHDRIRGAISELRDFDYKIFFYDKFYHLSKNSRWMLIE